MYANVVAVPAYPPRSSQLVNRLNLIIEDAHASIALTTSALKDSINKYLASEQRKDIDCIATDDVDLSWSNHWDNVGIYSDDLAFLQYTSGSTGSPMRATRSARRASTMLLRWGDGLLVGTPAQRGARGILRARVAAAPTPILSLNQNRFKNASEDSPENSISCLHPEHLRACIV
mgnify:CR=1 FL=1